MTLGRLHGSFNLISGLWAVLHRRSFEQVTGPKVDYWLVNTVAGLLVANGLVQLSAPDSEDGRLMSRRIGVGTATALAVIDVVYASRGRIRPVYLADAVAELGWVAAWTGQRATGSGRGVFRRPRRGK